MLLAKTPDRAKFCGDRLKKCQRYLRSKICGPRKVRQNFLGDATPKSRNQPKFCHNRSNQLREKRYTNWASDCDFINAQYNTQAATQFSVPELLII